MKTYLITASILFCAISAISFSQVIESGPNKGLTVDQVIGYRMAGIARIAKDAQSEAESAKLALSAVDSKYSTLAAHDAEKTKEAHDNAKQRDVLIYVFALSIGLYALQATSSLIPEQSGWFSIIAKVVVFFAAFGAAYAFGRFVLAWASSFIP